MNSFISSKQRLTDTLNHKEPDRIPFDLGSTKITGISLVAYRSFLNYKCWQQLDPVPFTGDILQQLVKPAEAFLKEIKVDTRGVFPAAPSSWKAIFTEENGYIRMIDEWGIYWKMPKEHGYYFDIESYPLTGDIDGSHLNYYPWPDSTDNLRFSTLTEQVNRIRRNGEFGITMHGVTSGVMEMALRIRGFEQFFMDLALEPVLAGQLLDKIVDIKIAYWNKALDIIGNYIMVAVESDDLGTQESLLISPELYKKHIKPRHQRLFAAIKKKAPGIKVFLHSCGAIRPLIPDLIEAGVDILNPVQVSAKDMNTRQLKRDFGKDLVFWGGGVDTQNILPNGTPQQVKDDVRRRIEDLAPGGGFVFNTVHNIQADVPPQNIEAMLEALQL